MPGLRHLIVVIPGIGGSVLRRTAKLSRREDTVWNAGFGDIADLVCQPGRLDVDEEPHLLPVGLIRSRQVLPGLTAVHGYGRLAHQFAMVPGAVVDHGEPERRVPNANVVFFPYDFRRSIVEAAELLAADVHDRLKDITPSARQGRVVVLAHSMGGLVARYWLGPLGGWPLCRALITLGTPHRGAPKALRWTVDGVRLASKQLVGLTALIRKWPSVAELLPRYPAVWDSIGGRALRPHEMSIPWLAAAARHGYNVHLDIERAWARIPRNGTEVVPRIGWSHATVNALVWDGVRLSASSRPPHWLDLGGWHDDLGDGTVPAFSAMPLEMNGAGPERFRVRQRHGPLGGAPWAVTMATQYERFPPLSPVRDGGATRPTLGLAMEEMYPAYEPVPLGVDLLPSSACSAGAEAWATVAEAGSTIPLSDTPLEPAGHMFRGELPPVGPGLYDVNVWVRGLGLSGDVHATDTFVAL